MIKWSFFISICLANFSIGYYWLSQTAIQDRTIKYYERYEIEGYKFRVLNEVFLYTLCMSGPMGTFMHSSSFSVSLLIGTSLTLVGAILKYNAGNNYWFAFISLGILG